MTMTTDELRVAVRQRGEIAVIDILGDVDGSADAALNEGYAQAMRTGARTVALNFEETAYINSTGIALIVGLLAKARTDHVTVLAFGLSDHYRGIFDVTRLSDFMTIAEDEDEAVGADA
jgi:anti-anti-sigma factor